jgi:hypothetical protein
MAAGQGFKTFTTGEVLTAGDVNGYLMQGVLVFASAAARDAAITSPQEGQFAFTKDTNGLWYYDGAAWVASSATGDIEGVTAGVGISGGGTSGTVTVTNSMATAIDAKGDLVVGTGADTFSKLTVGANGTTLVADSAEATGLKWAAAAGGKVLQVVYATYSTQVISSVTSYVDTGLTASITPSSATSKILVIAAQGGVLANSGNANNGVNLKLFRGATQIQFAGFVGRTEDSALSNKIGTTMFVVLDEPATTSSTTYKTQFANNTAAANVQVQQGSDMSTITLLEIGA